MNKKRFLALIIITSIVVVILIYYFTSRKENGIYGSGFIEIQDVLVSSKIVGQIKEIKIDEGTQVKEGDTLIIIDHRELLAQQKETFAGLSVAEQTLKEIQTRKKELEKNVQRLRNLYVTGDIPDKELENMETQLEVIETQEVKAIAGLKAARARLELVQTQIANAYIISPLSGIVLEKNFERGEIVFGGANLFKIGDLNTAWLKIYISERKMGRVSIGAKAFVYVDAYPKEVFEGKVTWISSEAEFTPKNIQTKEERAQFVFAIKITIPNEQQKLFPGMPADAKIIENGHN